MAKIDIKVPDIKTLLGSKIPNAGILDSLILDLDFKLDENTKQIENSVAALLEAINDNPGIKPVGNPKDGLQYIYEHRLLDRSSCYDIQTEHVIAFLQHVVICLEENPESCSQIFQQLVSFSEREGVCLPFKSTLSDQISDSVLSINTVDDNLQQEVAQLWENISRILRQHFIKELASPDLELLSCTEEEPSGKKPSHLNHASPRRTVTGVDYTTMCLKHDHSPLLKDKKLELVHSLARVCSLEETWNQYKTLRHKQLDRHFASLILNNTDEINISRASENCIQLASTIISYVDEDFLLFSSDVFSKVKGTFAAISDIYLEKFSDEMGIVIEEIQDELVKVNTTKMSQSKSAFAFKSSPIHALSKLRSQAKSIEGELKYVTSEESPDHVIVPLGYTDIICPIVRSFILIDRHVDALYTGSVWQVAGASSRNTRSRSNLRSALKASPSPDLKRRPMEGVELNSDLIDGGVTNHRSDSEEIRTPRVIERSKTEERPRWDWRLIFKKIGSDVVTLVDSGIKHALKICIADLARETSEYEEIQLSDVLFPFVEQPAIIFKSVREFMTLLDTLSPVAEAGVSGVFIPARTAFIDLTILSLQKLHTQISKICLGVPRTNPVRHVYVSLATSVFIENSLQVHNSILSGDKGRVFAVPERLYDDLTRSLSAQLVQVHTQLINNYIVCDAASNDWTSHKEYYENERCSLDVQMWLYHLHCLRNDLWSVCPGRVAQHVLLKVLDNSLDTLSRRYCRLTPSHRRVLQFRADVVTILHVACDMLYSVSQSVSQILDVGQHQYTHLNINNNCSLLLASMAVLTSPLHDVYKIFKKGFANSRISQDNHTDDLKGGHPTQWLSWIHPSLYIKGKHNVADMQTTNALYVLIKLVCEQPTPSYCLTLQALLTKDYTLPILLLTSAAVPMATSVEHIDDSRVHDVFTAMFTVLSLEDHHQDALAKLSLAVIDRLDLWEQLSVANFGDVLDNPPAVLRVILDLMKPVVYRVIDNVVWEITRNQSLPTYVDVLGNWCDTLPCGCPCQSSDKASRPKDGKDLTEWSIRHIVQTMSEVMELLPMPMCVLFKSLQEAAVSRNIRVSRGCIGLQFLAGSIHNCLVDFARIERVTRCELTADTRDKLTVLADTVYVTLSAITRTPSLTRTASHFRKRNKEWLALKLESITSYLHSPLFDLPEMTDFSDESTEFSDDLMLSVAQHVLSKPSGESNLRYLHHIIVNNKQWIMNQLDVRPGLPWLLQLTPTQKNIDLTPELSPRSFSHLTTYRAVGDLLLSQSSVMESTFDWPKLLQSDLGLTEQSLRSLLLRREDMQDSSQLGEADAKYARVLWSRFSDCDSL